MSTGKTAAQTPADNPFVAGHEWWKPQAVALQAVYGEALAFAETRLRKQADFLHQLARAKDLPDALKAQASFAQEFWADTTRDTLKVFNSVRPTSAPGA